MIIQTPRISQVNSKCCDAICDVTPAEVFIGVYCISKNLCNYLIILYLNIPQILFVQQDHVKLFLFLINDNHKYGRCVGKGCFFMFYVAQKSHFCPLSS